MVFKHILKRDNQGGKLTSNVFDIHVKLCSYVDTVDVLSLHAINVLKSHLYIIGLCVGIDRIPEIEEIYYSFAFFQKKKIIIK